MLQGSHLHSHKVQWKTLRGLTAVEARTPLSGDLPDTNFSFAFSPIAMILSYAHQKCRSLHLTKFFVHVQGDQEASLRGLSLGVATQTTSHSRSRAITAMAGTNGTNGSAPSDPKLAALREAMAAANGGSGVHAYIVPSEDPHMVRSA